METRPVPATRKERRKRALAELEAFRANARRTCGAISNANDWAEAIEKHVDRILKEYEDTLTPAWRNRLHEAGKWSSATREGVLQACHTLDSELGGVIEWLGRTPVALSPAVIAGIIVVVVAGALLTGVGKGVIEIIKPSVSVTLLNADCQPFIEVPHATFAGINIPGEQLRPTRTVEFAVPDGLSVAITPGRPAVVNVQLLLVSRTFDLPGAITHIKVTGKGLTPRDQLISGFTAQAPIVFRDTTAPYEVALSCR